MAHQNSLSNLQTNVPHGISKNVYKHIKAHEYTGHCRCGGRKRINHSDVAVVFPKTVNAFTYKYFQYETGRRRRCTLVFILVHVHVITVVASLFPPPPPYRILLLYTYIFIGPQRVKCHRDVLTLDRVYTAIKLWPLSTARVIRSFNLYNFGRVVSPPATPTDLPIFYHWRRRRRRRRRLLNEKLNFSSSAVTTLANSPWQGNCIMSRYTHLIGLKRKTI